MMPSSIKDDWQLENLLVNYITIGMVSNKMPLITFFEHKKQKNFINTVVNFYEKFSTAFDFGSYLESIRNFEAILLQKLLINLNNTAVCDQKMLLLICSEVVNYFISTID